MTRVRYSVEARICCAAWVRESEPFRSEVYWASSAAFGVRFSVSMKRRLTKFEVPSVIAVSGFEVSPLSPSYHW